MSDSPAMLRSCGKKLLLSLVGSMLTCLLMLVADQQKRQVLSLGGAPGGGEAARGFGAYFSQLSRSKREARAGAGREEEEAAAAPRRPVEEIAPRDVFIAVKTTKKFHKARLELLLDTWIARNKDSKLGGMRSVKCDLCR
ncbi:UNVERIFIED_CONTAM: hypothetical protein K2H54_012384 [Gekko kuhli]